MASMRRRFPLIQLHGLIEEYQLIFIRVPVLDTDYLDAVYIDAGDEFLFIRLTWEVHRTVVITG